MSEILLLLYVICEHIIVNVFYVCNDVCMLIRNRSDTNNKTNKYIQICIEKDFGTFLFL